MRTRLSSAGSGATTRRPTCSGRALRGRCVEAPLQGTPRSLTEAQRRIVERAAKGHLPPWVVEESEPDFRCIRELYEEKCLVGLHVSSPDHGGAYVHLRLSKKGRAIYEWLRAAFPRN